MSQKTKVRVYRGRKLIAEIERPLRKIAGVPAVKYHRKTWPLLPGNRIEIDKVPLTKTGMNESSTPRNGAGGRDGIKVPEDGVPGLSAGKSIVEFAREVALELE